MFEEWADADVGASQSAHPINRLWRIRRGRRSIWGPMDSVPAHRCQVKNSTFGQRFRAKSRAQRVLSALTTLWCGPYLSPAGRIQAASGVSSHVEVFTSAEYPLVRTVTNATDSKVRALDITVYEIDGIQSIENALSHDLPANPEQSKRMALQRIQRLDTQTRSSMQSSAHGLAKAMQYGIDRYPAIIFDGQAVVYGVTNLQAAIEHYETWRTGGKP